MAISLSQHNMNMQEKCAVQLVPMQAHLSQPRQYEQASKEWSTLNSLCRCRANSIELCRLQEHQLNYVKKIDSATVNQQLK